MIKLIIKPTVYNWVYFHRKKNAQGKPQGAQGKKLLGRERASAGTKRLSSTMKM